MMGIGLSELIIIGILALVFIGPNDLPKVAAQIARFINDIKRGADSFKKEFTHTELPKNNARVSTSKTEIQAENPTPLNNESTKNDKS